MGQFRISGIVVTLCALLAGASRAQTCSDTENAAYVPVAGTAQDCAAESYVERIGDTYRWVRSGPGAGIPSAGWHGLVASYVPESDFGPVYLPWHYFPTGNPSGTGLIPMGTRLGISLLASPSPGDFLAVGKNLAEHSTCLLPPGGGVITTDWQGTYRQTLDGKVDLVTGLPLVQVTDLEIPFAGATFRLNRTRSGTRADHELPGEGGNWIAASDRWWDWTGLGWMASENPLLLIDSALPDVTGDQPYTCYFIVDAHHSIPFQLIEATGKYEAPPRFRARMEHDGLRGTADVDGDGDMEYVWTDPPDQFDIYLYEGALHYTFVAIREDVPPNRWDASTLNGGSEDWQDSSYHDRPYLPQHFQDDRHHNPWDKHGASRGYGLPYYGLCTKVEDKFGHSVEIDYCTVKQTAMDDTTTSGCVECMQRTVQKGQIRSIKLKDNGTTLWTLVYAHRMFRGLQRDVTTMVRGYADDGDDEYPDYEFAEGLGWVDEQYDEGSEATDPFFQIHGSVAIDRIFVFQSDIDEAVLEAAEQYLTLTHSETNLLAQVDPTLIDDLVLGRIKAGVANFPDKWDYRVRYFYEENASGRQLSPPLLLRAQTTVANRDDTGGAANPFASDRVYQYDLGASELDWQSQDQWGTNEGYHTPWLRYIFDDAGLKQLRADWLEPPESWGGHTLPGDFDLYALARDRATTGEGYDEEDDVIISRYAGVEMYPFWTGWDYPTSQGLEAPVLADMNQAGQMFLTLGRLKNDCAYQMVHDISYADAEGNRQHCRLTRLCHIPAALADDTGLDLEEFQGWGVKGGGPHRSRFAHPFFWQAYHPFYEESGDFVEYIGLAEARWVAIVDRYYDRESLLDGAAGYGGDEATREGQWARRVVEMNPTGYVLRDRRFEFHPDGTRASGGGLGEQFRYQTTEDYVENVLGMDMPDPLPGDPDPWAAVRNELLLVQHLSVGWSAGWSGNDGAGEWDEFTEGLVHFYEYDANLSEDPWSFTEWPRGARVYLVAEGVQQGSADTQTKYYTRQVLRDSARPMEVKAEIEFTKWVDGTSRLLEDVDVPDNPSGPPPFEWASIRQYRTIRSAGDPDVPEEEWPVESRLVIGPPRQQYPGSGWYYPVEAEVYDTDGNSEWSITGLVLNPMDPDAVSDPSQSLVFTYYQRDASNGASKFTVVDASAGATTTSSAGSPVTIPGWPEVNGDEWSRLAEGYPKNAVTEFEYDDEFGLVDIYMPNYRRWSKRVVIKEMQTSEGDVIRWAREYIFNDLYRGNNAPVGGAENFFAGSPGEVNEYATEAAIGSPSLRRRVRYIGGGSEALDIPDHGEDPGGGIAVEDLWQVEMALDGNGRPREATLLEPDINGAMLAVGSKMYNDLGEVTREQEIDGSITRVTKNPLGFPLRTYVGTQDKGWVEAEDQDPTNDGLYDMVLVDRTEYGLGLHDAWQPTVVRRYRGVPDGTDWTRAHHEAVDPAEDTKSFATVTSYDWRMRPVRVDTYDRGVYDPDNVQNPQTPPRLSTTVTYLDHADRPRMIVTFGAGQLTLGTLDPTELTTAEAVPDPKVFYNVGIAPISVVEMEYGSDGTMTVRKSYDVAWYHGDGTGDVPFQAEHQYAGMGGQVVYSQRPSEPITRNVLDSFGRVLRSISILPGTQRQLARTDYFYDDDGNVNETWQWTRVKDDAVDELSGGNAVRTRSVSWYDKQKRLIATADLGTERPENDWVFNDIDIYSYGAAPTWSESGGVVRNGVPPSAQLWVYVHDINGNQTHVVDPKGIVTEYEYTSTGRMSRKIENAAATPAGQRVTTYGYEWGRVTSMAMTRTVGDIGYDGETQTSRVIYADEDEDGPCQDGQGCAERREGAEVVDEDFVVRTQNNAAVKWLELLGSAPLTTDDPQDPDLTFRYTFDGQVAERIDARGVSFRYWYDALGRIDSIEVGHYPPGDYSVGNWAAGYPASMDGPNGQAPADRIGYVEYFYDAAGRLSEVKTYAARLSGSPITHNKYDYDERGQILADWQAQGAAIDPVTTPHTAYAWEYLATDPENSTTQPGHHRLASMTYPTHDGSTPRTVSLIYEDPNDPSDAGDLLSRVASVESNFGTEEIASFEYVGVARRARTALAGGEIAQSFTLSTEVGLAGLDMFGRTKLLEFTNSLGDRLFSARYGYDANGNRIAAEISQYESQSTPNVRSQFNHYDDLNRLVGTDVGSVLWTNGVPSLDPNSVVRSDDWNLDLLGNWSGGSVAGSQGAGRESWGDLDGFYSDYALPDADSSPDTWSFTQDVNDHNELTGILLRDEDAGQDLRDDGPVYDDAGNLVFDGNYYFQYDAWNRLVQVNEATIDGQTGEIVLGNLLKHFMFDGLGRLVRTQTPTVPGGTGLKTERYYYDGLRRIQELAASTITTLGGATGDPTLEALASQTVPEGSNPDEQSAPAAYEEGQFVLAGGGGGGSGGSAATVAREYVWGPGDNGFDELLVQYNAAGDEAWAIQDAGGDLVAMCDLNGANGVAQVVGQWTYDAYGEVLTAEYLEPFAYPKLGHKGLFLDRLDGTYNSPRLVPFAHSLYHMRNRTYAPGLGRFLQRDPNQTAMALVEATAMHGKGLGSLSLAFDLEGLYGDGGNLYEYLGSSPWNRADPRGLSWDPFNMVDEYLAETAGNQAAFLNHLGQSATALAVTAAKIASVLPFPVVGVVGDLALYALGEETGTELAVGLALGLIPGGKLLGNFGKFLGGIAESAWGGAKHFASKFGRALFRSFNTATFGLAERAFNFLNRACGCFEAGTSVWTARGQVPIEDIREGDLVFARNWDTGETSLRRVLGTFVRRAAPIVAVTVSSVQGQQVLKTTEEHPFYVTGRGWVEVDSLAPGDTMAAAMGEAIVRSIAFTGEVSTVYNFEVEGLHDYFVGQDGLLVHNKPACIPGWLDHLHHALPMFLQGNRVQKLVAMPEHLHRMFHSELSHALTEAGIRRGGGTWARYFREVPDDLVRARNILIEKSADFDRRYMGQAGGYVQSLYARAMSELGL